MNRFRYLKNIDGNSDFIPMDKFFDKIKNTKRSDSLKFSPINDMMDLFYISLMIGLKKNIRIDFNDTKYQTSEMTHIWTEGLSDTKDLIIALYIANVIELSDKDYKDKKEIQELLNRKLGNDKIRAISDEGMIELHNYAFAGYIELLNIFDNKEPNDLFVFFEKIKKNLTIN
jgi:hypothetical protein